MHSDDAELNLLLSHFDDDAPVLEAGLPRDVAADHDHGDSGVTAESFYNLGAAGNDVGEQGWCVIAPEGDRGDALLGRIKPLVDARRELLGEEPRVYRVPPKMTADAAMKWRAEVYNVGDPDYIPRYQLLLGDLHEVPLELQQAQASEGYVGRLAFANDEDYNAYAEKVLAWERAPSAREDAESVFYTVHDGTAATRAGYRSLVAPVLTKTKEMQGRGRFQAGSIREIGDVDEPAPGELLDAAADLEAGVLFTMSHGAGAPRRGWSSVEAQRAGQGAMSFGREGHLAGSEIAGKPFAAGGVWFMFACFGAGTPDRSKFHHWLEQLSSVGQFRGRTEAVLKSLPKGVSQERPFIAALPHRTMP